MGHKPTILYSVTVPFPATMTPVSSFPEKQTGLLSTTWSWWWQSSSRMDELFRLSLTLAIVILAMKWVKRLFSEPAIPPLPPSPHCLPLVGHLPFLDLELHSYFACLARTYGPIFHLRFGMKMGVVVTSPSLARQVLRDKDTICANRVVPEVAVAMEYGRSNIVSTPNGPMLTMLRRVCVSQMLGSATLNAFYDLRRCEVRRTVSYLYGQAGSPVNVGEQMFLTLMNVMTSMLWGGTVKGRERNILAAEFKKVVAEMTALLGTPNVSDFFPGLAPFDLQGLKKRFRTLATKLDVLFNPIIEQRLNMDKDGESRDQGKTGDDFLQFLLNLKDEEDSKTPLTMAHVKALLMDMVVGGTDTTSNALEFAIAEMMNKPEVMNKAQQELEMVVGKDNVVEESHICKLPYLSAVMKETLRLHPILPVLVPHSPSETCVVGGYTIPKGVRIFVNVWAIHRDPSIWPNPSEFDPERFTDGGGSTWDYNGNNFNYFPFGSGRRMCAGIAMAERIGLLLLATLVHSFEWKLLADQKMDMTEKFGIVLKKKIPLVAIPSPRLSAPALYE